MRLTPGSRELTPSPQITAGDFEQLHAIGVRTVICNRPGGEEEGQLTATKAAELAALFGMAFRHIPMTAATLSRNVVEEFSRTVTGADRPVLAYCRSGTRSASLWALAQGLSGRKTAEDVVASGRALGLDFGPAAAWLSRELGSAVSGPGSPSGQG